MHNQKSAPALNGEAKLRAHSAYTSRFNLQSKAPEGITFKLVETVDELTQTCKILYDSYTEVGYMKVNETGYRFTPFYVLPSCYTLIAKAGDTVIATTTIIIKSQEELPVESIFSLTDHLKWDRRTAEASSFTVHPNYRSHPDNIKHAMLKYLFQIARDTLGIHDLVIACTPEHMGLYEDVLLFQRLSDEVIDAYDYVNGTSAVGARLDLASMQADYANVYAQAPEWRNMYKYHFESDFESFQIPRHAATVYSGNLWSPEQLEALLKGPIKGAAALSPDDLNLLRQHYASTEYDSVFSCYGVSNPAPVLDTNIQAVVRLKTNKSVPVVVQRLEGNQIILSAENPSALLDGKTLQITTGDHNTAQAQIRVTSLGNGVNATLQEYPSSMRFIDLLLKNKGAATQSPRLTEYHLTTDLDEEDKVHFGS
ncbi:hypothetical protein [Pseudovibrio sp. Tun.PSC04-5.I4]|uniref:N-acyl amino acid synthase FeeM domain-containing protein n=1 Tax=Pseudovibrio sp. Tun.PSC04-5.I4 TaxID=1798213 RepID=UPI000891B800|nr:hypothetical protein [Pseudovibrio sp. Tun.PSC04-5.I4]SDR35882.1 hypothetical protein SAMN04515695_4911 [Pseudovibrio sp. Tun.PSC04-5.I4]